MGYVAWAVAVAGGVMGVVTGGCGRDRPAADAPFLTRPAPGPDGRVAFVSQSRVWIADAEPAHDRRSVALPLDLPADRPRWLVDSARAQAPWLAVNVWSVKSGGTGHEDLQADLAIWNGSALERLTRTEESELLDDTTAGDRLLFERDGFLCEATIERSPNGAGLGPVVVLGPGRDGRYTPDGQHIVFARGHESDPLGLWHQGYEGGDDSEIYHLDLVTQVVTQLTDTPDNDELPVPLDNSGRRFVVCRERGGSSYRPWIVEIITAKKHRVRRLPMPDGAWPVLFPAVRWLKPLPHPLAALAGGDTSLSIELWAEANGALVVTRGEVQPTRLDFPAPTPVRMRLVDRGPKIGDADAEEGQKEWREITRTIAADNASAQQWRDLPASDRRRFQAAFVAARSKSERTEIVKRLLGRVTAASEALPPGAGELLEQ